MRFSWVRLFAGLSAALVVAQAAPLFARQAAAGMTCTAPEFTVVGWQDSETLVISATADPGTGEEARRFSVSFHLNHAGDLRKIEGVNDAVDVAIGKDRATKFRVPFSRERFNRLLSQDGEIHLHVQSTNLCAVDIWQDLTAYQRSLFRIEAGAVYSFNSESSFDTQGEAAVRFTTRWSTDLLGAVDLRYTGVAPEETEDPPAAKAGESDPKFNPFTSSDGVLRADFFFGMPFSSGLFKRNEKGDRRQDRTPPTLNKIGVAGFGLSTLRGTVDGREDLTDTKPRYFLGYRLTVPRFHLDSGTTSTVEALQSITAPRGYFQVSFARDEIWKFTVPATTTQAAIDVDERNRIVVEGAFEFVEVKGSGKSQTSVPITARLRWDTPADLKGASDLRVSVLAAFNFLRF